MTTPADDDFAFLFADEFKPDFSHVLDNVKKHKEEEVKVYDADGEREFEGNTFINPDHVYAPTNIEAQLTESSAEMLPTTPDIRSITVPYKIEHTEEYKDWHSEEPDIDVVGLAEEILSGTVIEEGVWVGFTVDEVAKEYEAEGDGITDDTKAIQSGALVPVAMEGTIVEDKPVDTGLSAAVSELERLKNMDIDSEQQENAIRAKLNETQKILDDLRNSLTRIHEDRRNHKAKVHQAETKVAEEAHEEAERKREADINAERKHAMMGFHSHIEELNPEWKDYAFNHQWEGAATLALHESGLLADEMGLGKTLSAIMYADMVKARKILVITPNDTASNFTLEFAMWAKHRFVWTLAGATKPQREVFMEMVILPRVAEDEDVTLVVNYEQLFTDMDYFQQLMDIGFDTIIIDEFHNANKAKNLLFQRIKSLKNSGAKRILPMTGTFILNKPEDIWTALHLVDEEAFPTVGQFRDHYCEYDYYDQKWVFRPGGERSMLIRLGGRIVKRNMAEAGIVLPEMHIHDVDIEFADGTYEDQRNIMRQLADHSQIILDSDRKLSIIEQIALITRQRQCAVWPAGINISEKGQPGDWDYQPPFSVGESCQESIKIDWVESKIKELRAGNKRVAVFSQFKTALAELERRLIEEGFRVVRYDGDTDKATKMKVKRDFDRKHVEKMEGVFEWDIVLCNFKTGGVGLNFTHITDMIMLDEEWNPGKNMQAYKRIQRIGQTEETHIWIPRLAGAIDIWMKRLNDSKADLIQGFDSEVDMQKEFNDFLSTVKTI